MIARPPSGWREVELRNLITELDAGVSVNSEDRPIRLGEVGVLKTSCVTRGTFDPSQHKAVIDKDVDRVATAVQPDRIIMSRMNTAALVGASAYVESNAPGLYLPDRLWQFGGRQGVADSRWLAYLLSAQQVRRVLSAIATGTSGSMKNLTKEQVRSLKVLLPPLQEQREVAAALKAVDAARDACTLVADQTDVVRSSTLRSLLGQHGGRIGHPSDWSPRKLGSVATFVNGRAFKPSDWKDSGVPIVRIQNLNGSADFNYFQGKIEPRYAVEAGDLLFSWSGTRGTSFGPHVWRGPPAVLNQHIFNVRDVRGTTKEFLFYALKLVTSEIEKRAHGGTGIVHITKGALEQFEIPVPPPAEQQRIATVLLGLDEVARAQREHLASAARLKGALTDALLSGRLRLRDAA